MRLVWRTLLATLLLGMVVLGVLGWSPLGCWWATRWLTHHTAIRAVEEASGNLVHGVRWSGVSGQWSGHAFRVQRMVGRWHWSGLVSHGTVDVEGLRWADQSDGSGLASQLSWTLRPWHGVDARWQVASPKHPDRHVTASLQGLWNELAFQSTVIWGPVRLEGHGQQHQRRWTCGLSGHWGDHPWEGHWTLRPANTPGYWVGQGFAKGYVAGVAQHGGVRVPWAGDWQIKAHGDDRALGLDVMSKVWRVGQWSAPMTLHWEAQPAEHAWHGQFRWEAPDAVEGQPLTGAQLDVRQGHAWLHTNGHVDWPTLQALTHGVVHGGLHARWTMTHRALSRQGWRHLLRFGTGLSWTDAQVEAGLNVHQEGSLTRRVHAKLTAHEGRVHGDASACWGHAMARTSLQAKVQHGAWDGKLKALEVSFPPETSGATVTWRLLAPTSWHWGDRSGRLGRACVAASGGERLCLHAKHTQDAETLGVDVHQVDLAKVVQPMVGLLGWHNVSVFGRIQGTMTWSRAWSRYQRQPRLEGTLRVQGMQVRWPLLGLAFDAPGQLQIEGLGRGYHVHADWKRHGQGTLALDGRMGWGMPKPLGHWQLTGQGVEFRSPGQWYVRSNPRLQLDRVARGWRVQGQVHVRSGDLGFDPALYRHVGLPHGVVLRDYDPGDRIPFNQRHVPLMGTWSLDVAPGVAFHVGGLRGTLKGHVVCTHHQQVAPLLSGGLRLDDPSLDVLPDVNVREAALTYYQTPWDDPQLNVVLTRMIATHTGAGLVGLQVKTLVGLQLQGALSQPVWHLYSIPNGLGDEQILFGLLGQQGGQGEGDNHQSWLAEMAKHVPIIGQALLSGPFSVVEKTLGFDHVGLNFIPTVNGDEHGMGLDTRLQLKKRLSRSMSLEMGITSHWDDSDYAWDLSWRLNPRWTLRTYHQTRSSGLQLLWEMK